MRKTVNNYESMKNLSKKTYLCSDSVNISNINTGFIDVPGQISLNIYVQGCKQNCPGCQNQDLLSFKGGTPINFENIPEILEKHSMPTWICWLGGDATDQPDGFIKFNEIFKGKNYKVCLYTGKQFEEITDLLENVDIVIDGPWTGTPVTDENTNQKVYIKENNKWSEIKFAELKEKLGEK